MFGSDINFKFGGDDQFTTKYGLFITIILGILLSTFTYYYSVEYLQRFENPNTQFHIASQERNLEVNLSDSRFRFAFVFKHGVSGQYLDLNTLSKSVEIKAKNYKVKYTVDSQGEYQIITDYENMLILEPISCQNVSWSQDADWINQLTPNRKIVFNQKAICFETDGIKLSRSDLEYEQSILLELGPCLGSHCNNDINIDEITMNVMLWNPTLDITNYDNPIKITSDFGHHFAFNSGLLKVSQLFLKEISVETHSGIIFNKKETKTEVTFENFETIEVVRQNNEYYLNSDAYFVLILTPSNHKTIVQRSYISIVDLLSSLGGVGEIICWLSIV